MTDLTRQKQLTDIKNGIVIFINQEACSDRLIDQLDGVENVFIADENTEVGKNLKTAFAIEYIPSAIFIKNGKFGMPVQGVSAILRGVGC